jgi:hypothetical protein
LTERSTHRLVKHLRAQGEACRTLGSPLYGALMPRAADDLAAGGPVAAVFAGHHEDPVRQALALRMFGTVHRLVLEGRAPALARFYPSAGADPTAPRDVDAMWAAFRQVLVDQTKAVRAGLALPPQTNEVGRASALIGGLLHLAQLHPLPVRLVEIGASGGLNLLADRFRIVLADGGSVGPATSPVVLRDAWRGTPPPTDRPVRIAERWGSDVAPVDVSTPQGRLLLCAYVWPDQTERLSRLRGAFALAEQAPVTVAAERAITTVAALTLRKGYVTVVWHSVMWQYVERAERAAIDARLDDLGRTASPQQPLARITLEPKRRTTHDTVEFLVTLRLWPDGPGERILGSAHPHGLPVTWEASPPPGR